MVAIRLGTVILFSPIEAIRVLPIHTRLILVLILSSLIVMNLTLPKLAADELSLIVGGIAEFCNGLILSLSLYATFAIFTIAGQLIDDQMGLNSQAILNPADNSHESIASRLLLMLGVLFFFTLNGHHKLLQSLAASFQIIPPGTLAIFNGFAALGKQFTMMFSLGFMLASPVIISLIVVDIAGAVLTRNMPQISTYFLTLPIKILLGLFVFQLLLNYIHPLMEKIFDYCFDSSSRQHTNAQKNY